MITHHQVLHSWLSPSRKSRRDPVHRDDPRRKLNIPIRDRQSNYSCFSRYQDSESMESTPPTLFSHSISNHSFTLFSDRGSSALEANRLKISPTSSLLWSRTIIIKYHFPAEGKDTGVFIRPAGRTSGLITYKLIPISIYYSKIRGNARCGKFCTPSPSYLTCLPSPIIGRSG